MSLNRLKETLRPCSNFSASSSTTTAGGASHALSSSTQFPLSRKPPKSSLSQQLQRLDPHQPLSEGLLLCAPDVARIRVEEEKDVDEEEKGGGVAATARFNCDAFLPQSIAFEARGPYEPLVLSSPGETPVVQLFNLFDWVAPGSLRTWEHFRDFYDEPLKHGQRLSAPERYVQIADERKQHLVAVLQKYLLRRTKEETIGHLMLGKEDNVVFCGMSELQKRVYTRMLEQPDVQCLINKDLLCSCGSPLAQVECCKKIVPNGIIWTYLHRDNPEGCESCPFCLVLPCLIKLQQLIKPNPKDDLEKQKKDAELVSAVLGADVDLIADVYTESRMLDILEKFLIRKGYCFSRLDGSTPMSIRQSLVDEFNKSPSKQKRHVIVFRLLAAGSLEELVYSRQIYKQQLSNIAVSGKMEKRYFQGVQDCKEFQGELFGICNLFRDLSDKLFTSEIIEMHEKKGKYLATQMSPLNTESENYITPTAASEVSFHGKSNEAAIFEDEEKLQELGIVYAHRNENVVNMGPGVLGQKVAGTHGNFTGKTLSKTRSNSMERIYNMGRLSSEQQKRNEFRSIAHNMGMEELQFSKWVLSASPSRRVEVLQNYKKKKKQMIRPRGLPSDK
ncbi:hypothetical protein B296_00027897 [Ensete ventricosum]|uniref:SNF2 N-terminal domain-containing protein n=1 Tax=Ensete ventricosum TaxID=4639 RepID=A0A426YVX7_ENSVE|nr:hypothetical protein B296_00027897 [Ensete ventricosum]